MSPPKTYRSPLKLLKKDRLCMKFPALEALCAKGPFQMQPHISGVNVSNDNTNTSYNTTQLSDLLIS